MVLIDEQSTEIMKDESKNDTTVELSESVIMLATLTDDLTNEKSVTDETVPPIANELCVAASCDQNIGEDLTATQKDLRDAEITKESEYAINLLIRPEPNDTSEENPNETQELDMTIGGVRVDKEKTIEEDQKGNLFPDTENTPPNKIKGNYKLFKEEELTFGVYQINKCGLITNRPVEWAKSLEHFIILENCDCNWTYQKKDGYYDKCEIVIIHKKKKITIQIQFCTGIITFQGAHYKEWLENHFKQIKNGLETLKSETNNAVASDEKMKICNKPNVTNTGKNKCTQEDMLKECDILWQKNEELTAALTTQDTVVKGIIERCQETELKVNDMNLDLLLNKMEQKVEGKLKALIETIYSDVENKIKSVKDSILGKIQDIYGKIDKLQQQSHKTLPHTENSEKIESVELQKLIEKVNKIDISGMEQSIEFNENECKTRIAKLEGEIKSLNVPNLNGMDGTSCEDDNLKNKVSLIENDLDLLNKRMNNLQKPRAEFGEKSSPLPFAMANADTRPRATPAPFTQNPNSSVNTRRTYNKNVELLVCMDSNGRYIEPRKLWKIRGSEYKRCSTLHDVSNVIKSFASSCIEHILICVGVNDLDDKDHKQVFSEAELLIEEIRLKHPNIKIIFSEITPRNDGRDSEVMAFNQLLESYGKQHRDITIVVHKNLRDPYWSMFKQDDIKHIRKDKIPKFAANIIGALKKAYSINSKSELFEERIATSQNREPSYSDNERFARKFTKLAGYDHNPAKQSNRKYPPMNKDFIEAMMEYAFQHT